MYGIQVKLPGANGDWSRPYTYKNLLPLTMGAKVVVPMRDRFAVGEVVGCVENPEWDPKIKWKWVVQVVDFTFYNTVKNT
jgi:hypothetical protein